ncbi:WxL domain-containing protein [Levilactobacillus yonginensis]
MKKSLSSLVLAGALLLGAVAPVTANAAAVSPDTTNGKTTTAVSITKPAPQTNTVDPTDPSKPIDNPDNPGGSSNHGGATVGGDLTFLYVSDAIDFGSHASTTNTADAAKVSIPAEKITSQAFNGSTANPDLVSEVADTRGTDAGWRVSVNATQLSTKSGDVIKGAKLLINASQATINNSAETVSKDKADIDGSNAIVPTDQSSQVLYTAQADHGAGATAMSLSSGNISLSSLPANIKTGDYSGILNWTLNDTPAD